MSDDGSDEAGYRVVLFHFLGFLFCPGCRCFHTRQALEHVSRCCAVAGSGLPHTLHKLRSPMGNAAMMVSSFTGFTSLSDSSVTPCNDLSLFFQQFPALSQVHRSQSHRIVVDAAPHAGRMGATHSGFTGHVSHVDNATSSPARSIESGTNRSGSRSRHAAERCQSVLIVCLQDTRISRQPAYW